MARRPTQQQLFAELLDRYGPEVAAAFQAAIADLRRQADVQAFLAALQQGNVDAALDALHLQSTAFEPLEAALRETYAAGGRGAVETMNGVARLLVGFRFDVRNLRAETWLRQHAGKLIRDILEDQRAAVRAALVAAVARTEHPRTTALTIVGRVSRATGGREGGIIGLNGPQRDALARARSELASGDPAQMRNYLTRKLRDRRFDRSVTKAIREGRPVPADVAASAAERYSARLLKRRGDTIGRTESLNGLRAAKLESYEQLVESGRVPADLIDKTWRSTRDLRTRDSHAYLNGTVVRLREPFQSISGALLMYPGDTSMGAPAEEIVECRCDFTARINWRALVGRGAR